MEQGDRAGCMHGEAVLSMRDDNVLKLLFSKIDKHINVLKYTLSVFSRRFLSSV